MHGTKIVCIDICTMQSHNRPLRLTSTCSCCLPQLAQADLLRYASNHFRPPQIYISNSHRHSLWNSAQLTSPSPSFPSPSPDLSPHHHPPASAPPPPSTTNMNLTNLLLAFLSLTLATAIPVPQADGEDGDTGANYVQCLALCNGDSVPCLNGAHSANVTVLGVSFLWYVSHASLPSNTSILSMLHIQRGGSLHVPNVVQRHAVL